MQRKITTFVGQLSFHPSDRLGIAEVIPHRREIDKMNPLEFGKSVGVRMAI